MAENITILVADDHPIFRQGLKQLIDAQPGFEIIGEADDGIAALRTIETKLPKIAVLDLDMPEMDGFGVAEAVLKQDLPVKIVILSMHRDELHIRRAIDLGINGYVVKDGAIHEIVSCLKTVAAGNEYFSPALTSVLLMRSRQLRSEAGKNDLSKLTPSELQIVRMLSELRTNRDIADALHISVRTVENHRANICGKLGLQGSHALVRFAVEKKDTLT